MFVKRLNNRQKNELLDLLKSKDNHIIAKQMINIYLTAYKDKQFENKVHIIQNKIDGWVTIDISGITLTFRRKWFNYGYI